MPTRAELEAKYSQQPTKPTRAELEAKYSSQPAAVPAPSTKPEPKLKLPEYSRGVGRSLLQGALLGFGDEAAAGIATGIAGITGAIPEGKTIGDTYREIKGQEAIDQAAFADENPKTAMAAELAGGLITAGATGGSSMAGAKTLGQVAKTGATQGATIGAVYGAGTADTGETVGESAINMAGGAATGAAIGGATGGTITPALVGTGRVLSAATKNIADRFFKSEYEKAVAYVQQLAEKTGFTPQEIADRYEAMGKGTTLADLSENLLAGAKSAVDQLGRTKEAGRKLVMDRQKEQFGETVSILSKQLGGASPADAAIALEKQAAERAAQAGPLYKKALQESVEQSDALNKLMASDSFKIALSRAGKYASDDLSRMEKIAATSKTVVDDPLMNTVKTVDERAARYAQGKLTDAERLHYAKQALYDMESAAFSAGNKEEAKNIASLRRSLTNDVLDKLPSYAEARKIWSGSMAQEEALDIGRNLFKLPKREFEAAIKGMTEQEKQYARLGLMDAAEDKLSRIADNQNTAGKLVRDNSTREKLGMLLDSDQMDALQKNADRWDAFTRTKSKLVGGSPTSENETVQQESARMLQDATPIGAAKNALFEAITNPNRITKENADEIGKLLLKQGMSKEEVVGLLTKAEKNPSILRDVVESSKNAFLVDYVPSGGALKNAALPEYGRVGINPDGSPRYGKIR